MHGFSTGGQMPNLSLPGIQGPGPLTPTLRHLDISEKEARIVELFCAPIALPPPPAGDAEQKRSRGRPPANDRACAVALMIKCVHPALTLGEAASLADTLSIGELKEKTLRGRAKKLFVSYAETQAMDADTAVLLKGSSWDSISDVLHPAHNLFVQVVQAHAASFADASSELDVVSLALEGLRKLKYTPATAPHNRRVRPAPATRKRSRNESSSCSDSDDGSTAAKKTNKGGRRPRFQGLTAMMTEGTFPIATSPCPMPLLPPLLMPMDFALQAPQQQQNQQENAFSSLPTTFQPNAFPTEFEMCFHLVSALLDEPSPPTPNGQPAGPLGLEEARAHSSANPSSEKLLLSELLGDDNDNEGEVNSDDGLSSDIADLLESLGDEDDIRMFF